MCYFFFSLSLVALSLCFSFCRISLISKGLFILFWQNYMSHGMLHHIEPKYSLNCCTYLKTLEKINRKETRNSRKKRKSHLGPNQPTKPSPHARARACAPSVPDRRAPPIGANPSALTPPSLSRCAMGPSCWRRSFPPTPRPLSLCPAVPNLLPMISPPWTRP
jgi:hypothetical protein